MRPPEAETSSGHGKGNLGSGQVVRDFNSGKQRLKASVQIAWRPFPALNCIYSIDLPKAAL